METITIELPDVEELNYRIRPVYEYEQMMRYMGMTEWCILFADAAFDYYLDNGRRRLYILEQSGYQDIKPEKGKYYPYDSYGFSLLAVLVNEDGSIDSITTRWNSIEEDITLGRDFLEALLGPVEAAQLI